MAANEEGEVSQGADGNEPQQNEGTTGEETNKEEGAQDKTGM